MNPEVFLYSVVLFFSIFISAVSQVLLKKVALKKYDSFIKEYLNPVVIIAYAIFFISTLLTIFAYKKVPLSMGIIFESTSYFYVAIFGVSIFKEKINTKKLLALFLIFIGVLLFSLY